jgi:hypothetical protein
MQRTTDDHPDEPEAAARFAHEIRISHVWSRFRLRNSRGANRSSESNGVHLLEQRKPLRPDGVSRTRGAFGLQPFTSSETLIQQRIRHIY